MNQFKDHRQARDLLMNLELLSINLLHKINPILIIINLLLVNQLILYLLELNICKIHF